uniref:plasmid recombination protein n=1 Tax=Staphylococcus saprophyticus TaxID=29385 RepID=UPI00119EE4D7
LQKSYLNYHLLNDTPIHYNQKIHHKIQQNYNPKPKITKHPLKHIHPLITSPNQFFKNQTLQQTNHFFQHPKTFLQQHYPKHNLLYPTLHIHQKTPHIHYPLLPITQHPPFTPKHLLPNKNPLTQFQHTFNQHINTSPYHFTTPITTPLTPTPHHHITPYKNLTHYHKQQYHHHTPKLHPINQQTQQLIQHYQNPLHLLKNPINLPYHLQTQKLPPLFNKQTHQTPNLLIHKNQFHLFHQQLKPSQLITHHYQYIKTPNPLKHFHQKNKTLQHTLLHQHIKNPKLIHQYNHLPHTYNNLFQQNQQKQKHLNPSYKLFNNLFNFIKPLIKQQTYHSFINHIHNHLQTSKIPQTIILHHNHQQFFNKKYQTHQPQIIFQHQPHHPYTL